MGGRGSGSPLTKSVITPTIEKRMHEILKTLDPGNAIDLPLAELEGSPRQVAWAEKLRDETMSIIRQTLDKEKDWDVSYLYWVSDVNENAREYREVYKKGEKAMAAALKAGEKRLLEKGETREYRQKWLTNHTRAFITIDDVDKKIKKLASQKKASWWIDHARFRDSRQDIHRDVFGRQITAGLWD